MNIPRIESSESLTVFFEGRSHTVRKSKPEYAAFAKAVEADDANAIRLSLGLAPAIKAYTKGAVSIEDGEAVYQGEALHRVVLDKIQALMKAGKKYEYMLNFLERVCANPLPSAVEELYLFLENGQIPITPGGHFLAYRNVDSNYRSYHANPDGTYNLNTVGSVVSMDRELVDANRNSTCSTGLHFCSFSYLSSYHGGSGHTMIVSIDPADVVSIPSDYSNAKGRCCQYTVVAEHEGMDKKEAFKDVVLANPDGTAHEGRDIEPEEIKFAKAVQPKNRLHKRIIAYVRGKLNGGKSKAPTLRQIQSTLSPRTPTINSLEKMVIKLGFKIKPSKTKGKGYGTVSE